MKILRGVMALLMVCAAGFFCLPQASAQAAIGSAEQEYRLANGMKVILIQKPDSEMAFFQVLVKAGSGNEKSPEEYGLAHLMEHMAFKGSKERPVAVLSPLMENNGGSSNAYTGEDETGYFVNFPPEKSALALDILSGMIFNPAYDPKEYEAEKEVIAEEIRVSEDTPARRIGSDFARLFYPPEHPYGHPTLGSLQSVKGAGRDTALAFKSTYYRPDNMALMVIGKFDAESVKADIEKYFGRVKAPSAPLPPPLRETAKIRKGPEVKVVISEKISLPKLMIGFDGVDAGSPLAPSLELAAAVLGSGDSSRLERELKEKRALVASASASSHAPKLQGIFSVSIETDADKIIQALQAVLDEISLLSVTPPSAEELRRAKNQVCKNFSSVSESMYFGYGMQVASFETRFGDWRLMNAWLPRLDRVSGNDLSAALAEIARPDSLRVLVMLPAKNAQVIGEKDLLSAAMSFKPAPQQAPAESQAAIFSTLDCGAELFVVTRPGSRIMTIKAGAPGGRSAEPADKPGLAGFTARVWAAGSLNNSDAGKAAGDLGGQIDGFSDMNSMGLSGIFLEENQGEGLELFAETLCSPAFNEKDVTDARREISAALKRQTEMLSSYTGNLLNRLMYRNSPYGHNPLGEASVIDKLGAGDLKDFYYSQVWPQRLVIVVTGDVDPEKIKADLNRLIKKPAAVPALKHAPAAAQPSQGPAEYKENLERSQTNLAMGFATPGLGSPEQAALDVLSTHLSGLSGPLFREMRDARSLAYRVSSSYTPYNGSGTFAFRIGTDPQKVQEALACFENIITRVKSVPLTEEELEGAKTFLVSRLKTRHQTASGLAGQLFEYRICAQPEDSYERYLQAIQKVSAQDVLKAAEYLDMRGRYLVSVGKQ